MRGETRNEGTGHLDERQVAGGRVRVTRRAPVFHNSQIHPSLLRNLAHTSRSKMHRPHIPPQNPAVCPLNPTKGVFSMSNVTKGYRGDVGHLDIDRAF